MNFLSSLLRGIVGFVQRNPLLTLLIVLLAIFAPSVLKGVGLFVLYFMLGIVLVGIVSLFALRSRVRRMQDQMRGQTGRKQPREGEIRVHKIRGMGEKRVRGDVGDYVEFEEIEIEETEE